MTILNDSSVPCSHVVRTKKLIICKFGHSVERVQFKDTGKKGDGG